MTRIQGAILTFIVLFAAQEAWSEQGSSSSRGQGSQGQPAPDQYQVSCRFVEEQLPLGVPIRNGEATPRFNAQEASFRMGSRIYLRVFCKAENVSEPARGIPHNLTVTYQYIGVPACGSGSSGGICVEQTSNSNRIELSSTLSDTGAWLVLKNPGTVDRTLSTNSLKLSVRSVITPGNVDLTQISGPSDGNAQLRLTSARTRPSSCTIAVTGAMEAINDSNTCSGFNCPLTGATAVQNGELTFSALLRGTSGLNIIPDHVVWSSYSGPGLNPSTGVWHSPPKEGARVDAKVYMKDDSDPLHCSIQVRPVGTVFQLKLSKYGDCPLFRSQKKHYYWNSGDTAPQPGGYPAPLSYPGLTARYGHDGPEIPFGGVLNAAADLSGGIKLNASGQVDIPPINNRAYKEAVIVAMAFDPARATLSAPLAYARLNLSDYSTTQMVPLNETALASYADNTLVTFRAFLAHKQMSGSNEVRGTGAPNAIPIHQFTEALAQSSSTPFDKLIPFTNESCLPVFQIPAPLRSDKVAPRELSEANTCVLSRTFRMEDFKAGRVSLNLMHLTPVSAHHEFPLDLLAAQVKPEPCNPASNTNLVSCWNIPAGAMPGSPTWQVSGGASRPVRSSEDECSLSPQGSGRLGYRYSIEAMAMATSLICAAHFDRPNEPVRAVLSTDAAFSGAITPPPNTGYVYENIGCLLGEDVNKHFSNSSDDAFGDFTKLHSFVYTKSMQSRACVKQQTIYARPWGYDANDGNFSDYSGHKTIPLCIGSQFAEDTVSLSWSPLILDLAGKGIRVSREPARAVQFDIRGNGKPSKVDWPENTSEVALLVLPGENGEVNSIRHLFGEFGAKNGFEALRKHDSNKDGAIDARDEAYGRLRLWLDLDRDGKAGSGELFGLKEKGVESISLKYQKPSSRQHAEFRTLYSVYYNSLHGRELNVGDYYFYEYVGNSKIQRK